MLLKDLISEALCEPTDYKGYLISRKLTELCNDKEIVEGMSYAFNLGAYAKAKQCTIVNETSVHNQIETEWNGLGEDITYSAENSWLNVLWRGQLLDVLLVSWFENGYKKSHHWIVADTRALAEEFFCAVCAWDAEVRGEILIYDDTEWEKNEDLFNSIKRATFDNLILAPALRLEIKTDFERFFASRELYEKYGIPWKRGVLLVGPPGNGKTHTVKALINHLKQPCLYVKNFNSCMGPEHSMKVLFDRARHTTPCIIVLEDLDSLFDKKSKSYFLNELDGFATNTGVVVLATTNHPEKLDTAILDRPSRFDRKYHFELPGPDERQAYVSAWNATLQPELRLTSEGINSVVAQTDKFSFAYLKELFLSSMMQWISFSGADKMDDLMLNRAIILREQMSKAKKKDKASDDEKDKSND